MVEKPGHSTDRQASARPPLGRGKVLATGAVLALLALVGFSATALAAKPTEGGCWGNCAPTQSDPQGTFMLTDGSVKNFYLSRPCLGDYHGYENGIIIDKSLRLNQDNTLNYSGYGTLRLYQRNGVKKVPAPVTLSAHFPTSTTADFTLTVKYKSCGTYTVKMKRVPLVM
jgi:hypothetical protein